MKWLRPKRAGERGVAMVVVLLVGSVMTVVASTATFVTIQEFQAGGDDRQATRALAIAEAGVDRMMQAIGAVTWEWSHLMESGCPGGASLAELEGEVEGGEFHVEMRPIECPTGNIPLPFEEQRLAILSSGTTGEANRQVEQIIRVVAGGLPIGIFAYSKVSVNGNGNGLFENISLITPGDVSGRDQFQTEGYDVWLSQDDFYDNGVTTVCDTREPSTCNPDDAMPAAVHAGGDITCNAASTCNSGNPKTAHVSPGTGTVGQEDLNCTANSTTKTAAWDGSRNGGPIDDAWDCADPDVGKAPTSLFTASQAQSLAPQPQLTEDDYNALKDAAQSDGIYCEIVAGKMRCTKRGTVLCTNCGTFSNADLSGLPDNYVIYGDFPVSAGLPSTLPQIKVNATLGTCDVDPDVSKSVVVIVKFGGLELAANQQLAGVVVAEEGLVDVGGGALVHGSIIAEELLFRGSSEFLMDHCSLGNLTVPFIVVTAEGWRELDR